MATKMGSGRISDVWSVELEEDEWSMVLDGLYLQHAINLKNGYVHPTLSKAIRAIRKIFEEDDNENDLGV